MRLIQSSTLGCRYKKKNIVVLGVGLFILVILAVRMMIGGPKFRFNYHDTFFAVPEKPPDIVRMLKDQQCKIPVVNPYNPDILSHLVPSKIEKCRIKKYGVVANGVLTLKVSGVMSAYLYYIRRVDDFTNKIASAIVLASGWFTKDIDIRYPITEEFFLLVIKFGWFSKHVEYHATIVKNSTKDAEEKVKKEDQLNVILLLFDSVSHAHAQRSLSRSYKYLLKHPRTTIMQGQSIVGDGTTAQLCALFTGKPERELPEARRGKEGAKPVDDWPWIFKDFHHHGYKTLYSEEYQYAGTFQYRLKGFVNPPTTHYGLPLWLAMQWHLDNNGVSCHHQFNFRYLDTFLDAYPDHNKFAFVFNALTHNRLNLLENADADILNFYEKFSRSTHANNTVVVLFGDHGLRASTFRSMLQGKLEERLPFMAITLPPSFDKYETELNNLRRNSHLMTSHFDTHVTLQHLLTFPKLNEKTRNKFGKSLFTDIASLNRTCGEAGVDVQWCTCLKYETVSEDEDENVVRLIKDIIKYMNDMHEIVVNGSCATLTLGHVINAVRRKPSEEVSRFMKSETAEDGCDSCVAKYSKDSMITRYEYEVNFSVEPSGGTFEALGEVVTGEDGGVKVMHSTDISRTNMYGDAPKCVGDRFPHLRKFCYCVR